MTELLKKPVFKTRKILNNMCNNIDQIYGNLNIAVYWQTRCLFAATKCLSTVVFADSVIRQIGAYICLLKSRHNLINNKHKKLPYAVTYTHTYKYTIINSF